MRRAAVALRHLCFDDAGLRDSIHAQRGFDLLYCPRRSKEMGESDNHDAGLLIILAG